MAVQKIEANLTAERVAKLKAEDEKTYANLPDKGMSASIEFDYGDTVLDAVENFTEEVVMDWIEGHSKFTIQEKMRNMLAQGKTPEEIQLAFYNPETGEVTWKPQQAPERKSAVDKEKDRLTKLDPEKRDKEIAALRAMLAGLVE